MTPTAICETFIKIQKLTNAQLLNYRANAFAAWGRIGDVTSEVIALQAEQVCRERGL